MGQEDDDGEKPRPPPAGGGGDSEKTAAASEAKDSAGRRVRRRPGRSGANAAANETTAEREEGNGREGKAEELEEEGAEELEEEGAEEKGGEFEEKEVVGGEVAGEEESKTEIASLAAASGFATTSSTTFASTSTSTRTSISASAGGSGSRRSSLLQQRPGSVLPQQRRQLQQRQQQQQQQRPGAYAVDGPDHGSQSSLFGSGYGNVSGGSSARSAISISNNSNSNWNWNASGGGGGGDVGGTNSNDDEWARGRGRGRGRGAAPGSNGNGNATTNTDANNPDRVTTVGAEDERGGSREGGGGGGENTNGTTHTNNGNSPRRRGSVRSVQSGQSDNSAVAEVRAALAAEHEAARVSGMGMRRPSLARSSMTSGIGIGSGGGGTASDATGTHTGSGRRRVGGGGGGGTDAVHRASSLAGTAAGAADLSVHPDIEFLAEATLVIDSVHDEEEEDEQDEEGRGTGNYPHQGNNHNDPPPDYDEALLLGGGGGGGGDEEAGYDDDNLSSTSWDVSTLGLPRELALANNRQRSSSNGGGNQGHGQRQRRSARTADPFSDVPEATCTSVDEMLVVPPSRLLVVDGGGTGVGAARAAGARGAGAPAEHSPGALGMENEDLIRAEPLKDKCLLPRRTVVIGVIVGFAILMGVALGVAIPLAQRKDGDDGNNGGGGGPSPGGGGGGSDVYPASTFNPPNSQVLTTVPDPICFSLLPVMTNISEVCTDPVVDLPKGGPTSQLIAEGLLNASDPDADIDIAIINGGAFRSDIFAGNLTAGAIRREVMPFTNNRVAYLAVTPAELYDTLNGALFDTGFLISEEQQLLFFPESPTVPLTWAYETTYPYAAGLRYDVDLNAPEGQKATNVRIRSSSVGGGDGGGAEGPTETDGGGGSTAVEDGWTLLDPTDETTLIRVLSSDYLAGGGDGYFQTVPEERIEVVDALGVTQLFLYYCSLQAELLGPHYIDGMSTRNFVPLEGYDQ